MTEPVSQQFGVKFITDTGEHLQLNQEFDNSEDAAAAARDIYSKNPYFRDIRVVDAVELTPFDEAQAPEGK